MTHKIRYTSAIMMLLNGDLKYITNATGSWVAETLDSIGDVGWYTSIAVDSQDKVHISYYDDTNDDLKYITNVTGSWVAETLDSIGDVGWVYLHGDRLTR